MKKICLYITVFSIFSCLHAESELKDKLLDELSRSYSDNIRLIHQKGPEDAKEQIKKLTNTYIDHMHYIKTLSDEQLLRELGKQKIGYEANELLLKKHILNLYDREIDLLMKTCTKERYSEDNEELKRIEAKAPEWDELEPFLIQFFTILERAEEHPGLFDNLRGKAEERFLREKFFEYTSRDRKHRKKGLLPHAYGYSWFFPTPDETLRVGYVVLGGVNNEEEILYKIKVLKNQHGFSLSYVHQIDEITTKSRILTQIKNNEPKR